MIWPFWLVIVTAFLSFLAGLMVGSQFLVSLESEWSDEEIETSDDEEEARLRAALGADDHDDAGEETYRNVYERDLASHYRRRE